MCSFESLKDTITNLYREGIGEEYGYDEDEIEEMLDCIHFRDLAQVLQDKLQRVYAYTTQSQLPKSFNYRGPDLFGQSAALLYSEMDQVSLEAVTAGRCWELWLLEDMTLAVTSCVSVQYEEAYSTEYRVIKEAEPWESDLSMDLEEITVKLAEMCFACFESEIPIYEL